jgi:hypothetical protein
MSQLAEYIDTAHAAHSLNPAHLVFMDISGRQPHAPQCRLCSLAQTVLFHLFHVVRINTGFVIVKRSHSPWLTLTFASRLSGAELLGLR